MEWSDIRYCFAMAILVTTLPRHLREIERTKMCGRIIRIVKKKRRIAIHHPTAVGVL
jgi:hypothetical protein